MKSKHKRSSVAIQGDTYDSLKEYCDRTGMTIQSVVVRAVESYLQAANEPVRTLDPSELTIMGNTTMVALMKYAAVNNVRVRDLLERAVMLYIGQEQKAQAGSTGTGDV